MGDNPDGVHRWVFKHANLDRLIVANMDMLGLEYGISRVRFNTHLHTLEAVQRLRRTGTARNSRFSSYFVDEPPNYDPDDEALGQLPEQRGIRPDLTPEDLSDAQEIWDQLNDDMEDLYDEMDFEEYFEDES